MKECCRAYLLHGERLIQEWAFLVSAPAYEDHFATSSDDRIFYFHAIHDSAELHARILEGEPCPWHNSAEWGINGWKNYLAVMESVKA